MKTDTDDRRAAHIRFLRMAADGKLPITNKALLADIRRELASIGEGRKSEQVRMNI